MAVDVPGAEVVKVSRASREFRGYGPWGESEIQDSPPPASCASEWAAAQFNRMADDITRLIDKWIEDLNQQEGKAMKMETVIKLGEKYKDKHTGFEGVAIAVTFYENGCVSACLAAAELHDGKELNQWFDEQRITGQSAAETGGPGVTPPAPSRPF